MIRNRGISKAIPKTSSIRVMKEKNAPNSVSCVTPSGVNPMSAAMPLGST